MNHRSFLLSALITVSSFLVLCFAAVPAQPLAQSPTNNPGLQPPVPRVRSKVPEELKRRAQTQVVHVIVQLNVPTRLEASLPDEQARLAQRQAIKDAQDELLKELSGTTYEVTGRLKTIPAIGLKVSADALTVLERSQLVVAVTEDIVGHFSLRDSVPLIEANQAWAVGGNRIIDCNNRGAIAVAQKAVRQYMVISGAYNLASVCVFWP